jgi:protein-tyrosine phosphatase
MFKSVLMVCVGNICRSPMAEYYFRTALAARDHEVTIASAGVRALVGRGADDEALAVMAEQGIDLTPHHARQLSLNDIIAHELILVMEEWQRHDIEHHYPVARGKVHLLGKWQQQELADPYLRGREAFNTSLTQIEAAFDEWYRRVWA